MRAIEGARVLIAEDEPILGMLAVEMLSDMGAIPFSPVTSVARGLALLARETPDAAMIDLYLGDGSALPLLEACAARGVPALLVTGAYDAAAQARGVVIVQKPYSAAALRQGLEKALAGA